MKTAADLDRMPMAEYFGWMDGAEGREYRNAWTRKSENETTSEEYKRGYDAGTSDREASQAAARELTADWRANVKRAAADLIDEWNTQQDAIGRG